MSCVFCDIVHWQMYICAILITIYFVFGSFYVWITIYNKILCVTSLQFIHSFVRSLKHRNRSTKYETMNSSLVHFDVFQWASYAYTENIERITGQIKPLRRGSNYCSAQNDTHVNCVQFEVFGIVRQNMMWPLLFWLYPILFSNWQL